MSWLSSTALAPFELWDSLCSKKIVYLHLLSEHSEPDLADKRNRKTRGQPRFPTSIHACTRQLPIAYSSRALYFRPYRACRSKQNSQCFPEITCGYRRAFFKLMDSNFELCIFLSRLLIAFPWLWWFQGQINPFAWASRNQNQLYIMS